jgi:hypothetical protein
MCELGLIDEFLKLPHQKVETLTGQVGAEHLKMVDFRHVPTHCKFLALMPQWDFLNFVAQQGKRYKTFDLRMTAEATDLVEEAGRITGLRAKTPDGILTIRAALAYGRRQIRPRFGRLQSRRRRASPRFPFEGPSDFDRDQAVPRPELNSSVG